MCDSEIVNFKDGDIVWVKLGSFWWPGEVKDLANVPKDVVVDFKKPPLAVVKFFQEDSYEYVRNLSNIIPYSCSKKYDFIKKGLDSYRAKNSHMEKFPTDVCTAETKTDGDPNILNDPYFLPEKKPDYSTLFGSPNKKSPKDPSRRGRTSLNKSHSGSSKRSSSPAKLVVTHRRFLGQDDHEVRILVQTPQNVEPEETSTYKCAMCGFNTSRIEVIVLHNKSHIQGVYTPVSTTKKGKRSPTKKTKKVIKMSMSKTSTIDEDLELLEKGLPLTVDSNEEDEEYQLSKPKRKPRIKTSSPKRKQKSDRREHDGKRQKSEVTKKSGADIGKDLLAEWDDENDGKKEEKPEVSKKVVADIGKDLLAEWEDDSDTEFELNTSTSSEPSKNDSMMTESKTTKDGDKSCFDFEEDEEHEIISTSSGRKIPRVLPHTDKQKFNDKDEDDSSLCDSHKDNLNKEIKDGSCATSIEEENSISKSIYNKEEDPNIDAFNSILEATNVPKLPEIPTTLKSEQNFPSAETVKFPDKTNIEEPLNKSSKDVESSKLINPKKRFVKTFEDFELFQSEQRKSEEKHKTRSDNEEKKYNLEVNEKPEKVLHTKDKIIENTEELVIAKNQQQQSADCIEKCEIPKPDSFHETTLQEKLNIHNEENESDSKELLENKKLEGSIDTTDEHITIEKDTKNPSKTAELEEKPILEVSKLKTQLMSKLTSPEKPAKELHSQSSERKLRSRSKKSFDSKVSGEMESANSSIPESTVEVVSDVKELQVEKEVIEREKSVDDLEIENLVDNEKNNHIESPAAVATTEDDAACSYIVEEELSSPVKQRKTGRYSKKETIVKNEDISTDRRSRRRGNTRVLRKRKSLDLEQPSSLNLDEHLEDVNSSNAVPLPKSSEVQKNNSVNLKPDLKSENDPDKETDLSKSAFILPSLEETNHLISQGDKILDKGMAVSQKTLDENEVILDSKEKEMFSTSTEQVDINIQEISGELQSTVTPLPACSVSDFKQSAKDSQDTTYSEENVQDKNLKIDYVENTSEDTEHLKNLAVSEAISETTEQIASEKSSAEQVLSLKHSAVVIENEITIAKETNQESVEQISNTHTEEMSALTTLAAVSELTNNFNITDHAESEIQSLPTDGNLTVVTEKDLADKQVEIATNASNEMEISKPITLTNFSLDFSDSFSGSNDANVCVNEESSESASGDSLKKDIPHENDETKNQVEIKVSNTSLPETMVVNDSKLVSNIKEQISSKLKDAKGSCLKSALKMRDAKDSSTARIKEAKESGFSKIKADTKEQVTSVSGSGPTIESEMAKITNTIPEIETVVRQPEQKSNSSFKLLEILTDTKPKATNSSNINLYKSHSQVKSKNNDFKMQKESPGIKHTIGYEVTKGTKFVIKQSVSTAKTSQSEAKSSKPIIISEKIIKPISETESVSVQKVTSKRTHQDVEDIDTFIIQKPTKKIALLNKDADKITPLRQISKKSLPVTKSVGKARILQQTIITPTGDIIQPNVSQSSDDNVFDINSMPIVLSDQILTPESIENMPIMLSSSETSVNNEITLKPIKKVQSQVRLLNKSSPLALKEGVKTSVASMVKAYTPQKTIKTQKVYQAQTQASTKLKHSPAIITQPGKPGKFIIVPSGSSPTGTKYTVGKRSPAVKRSNILLSSSAQQTKVQNIVPEPTGNKIMIVTNQQGQQSRVLLTPAQQKLLGYQTPTKITKTTLKNPIVQKSVLSKGNLSGVSRSNIVSQAVISTKSQPGTSQNVLSSGQILTSIAHQQVKGIKLETKSGKKNINQRMLLQNNLGTIKTASTGTGQQKTILIKNQHGQTLKKLQATDDALLDQQVQEQLQAIKASEKYLSGIRAQAQASGTKSIIKPPVKRYVKKPAQQQIISTVNKTQMTGLNVSSAPQTVVKTEAALPPLAPISPVKKVEIAAPAPSPKPQSEVKAKVDSETSTISTEDKTKTDVQRPLHQLVIQDAMGNQTTITEGQILALPSETVDGQPQSYMLVTLDETGNLTPLNNEALMSLDQNLGLGGDVSNMVLQIDQNTATIQNTTAAVSDNVQIENQELCLTQNNEVQLSVDSNVLLQKSTPEQASSESTAIVSQSTAENVIEETALLAETASQPALDSNNVQAVSINNEATQQLLVTGDVISTQKFLESLTEGNADLANILANAEGSSILIQADGQQILINTEPDNNQVLLSLNSENLNLIENTESGGNPIFATQSTKNQDILAAALADTDVFQPDQNGSSSHNKVTQSQLSPNSTSLYPMNVGNVLETSLTLSSPIMTPLEVPSTNNKKIADDETDILTQVPKNVDLPITITDPNISQTVSHQHVASLIAGDLQNNLELPLPISEGSISVASTEINSPSYVYSLPSLDDSVDIGQKAFNSSISMPLLTEEPEESSSENQKSSAVEKQSNDDSKIKETIEEPAQKTPDASDGLQTPQAQAEVELTEAQKSFENSSKIVSNIPGDGEPQPSKISGVGCYIEEEGLCTLGGEMCSSLSEPPPDMFDVENSSFIASKADDNPTVESEIKTSTDVSEKKVVSSTQETDINKEQLATDEDIHLDDSSLPSETASKENMNLERLDHDEDTRPDCSSLEQDNFESSEVTLFNVSNSSDVNSPSTVNTDENSCEIPVQPPIVTDLMSETFENFESNSNSEENNKRSFSAEEDSQEGDSKRCKFD